MTNVTNERFETGFPVLAGILITATLIFAGIIFFLEKRTDRKFRKRHFALIQAKKEFDKILRKSDSDWAANCYPLSEKLVILNADLIYATGKKRKVLCEKIDRLEKKLQIANENHKKFAPDLMYAWARYQEELEKDSHNLRSDQENVL